MQINALKDDLQELARRSPSVQVSVDAARAATELAQVEREVNKLDGRNARVDVNVGGNASFMLSAISAGALGVGAALAPATALLASLPAVGAGAAGALGAVFAAVQGVGDGVKALDQYQKTTAASATTSAAQQVAAANSIATAQDGVRNAVRGVADAQHAADLANENAARSVQAAITGQQRAEESLAAAQRQAVSATTALKTAQDALTEARKAAQRQLEDLQMRTEDGALAERHALLTVEQAKADLDKTLADPAATDLQRRQAQLAYDEATQHLKDQQLQNRQLADDKAAADKAGVEGSKQVTSAQQGVTHATQGVEDAQRGVADAQRGVAQAADALAVAQKQQAETQRQGAENVTKAQEQVTAATRALQGALASAGAQGSTALNTLNFAMSQLSPAGQHFARFLHDELIPQLHSIRDSVQDAALPLMETAFRNLGTLTPILTAGLTQTATVMGNLTVRASQMMASGPWQADFATIMGANNVSLSKFGDAGLSVMDVMRNLAVESLPLIDRIADLTKHLAAQAQAWIQEKRDTGELATFFHQAGDALMSILDAAGKVAVAAVQLAQALAPLGMGTVALIGDLAEFVGWLSKIDPELAQVAALAIGLAPVLGRLGAAWDAVTGAVRFFAASNLEAKFQSVALGAGTVTEKLVGYAASSETAAAAGEKVASAGGRVAGAAARIGSTIPVVGAVVIGASIAFDALTTSADDAAAAMLQGGAAAAQMAESMRNQSRFASLAHNDLVSFVPLIGPIVRVVASWTSSTDDATRAMKDQLAAMDPLHRAQAEMNQAQNDYLFAVSKGPSAAGEAADAQRRYATASGELNRQQQILKDGLTSATDAMKEQRDQLLGNVDAALRFESAQLATERALRSYTDAVAQNGAGSLEAREALNQYNQSLAASVTAAGDASRAQNANKDAAEQDRLAIQAQNDEIWRLIQLAGSHASPALLQMAGGMSDADLKARGATVSVDHLGNRIVSLPGGPGKPPVVITISAYTGPAENALNHWLATVDGRQVTIVANMVTPQGVPIRQLGGGATGAVVEPMALGGIRTMSSSIAQVVPPNTPRLIGDRLQGKEYFLPDDNAPRTMAIGSQWARDRGLRLVPIGMDSGGVLGSAQAAASTADLFAGLTDSADKLTRAGLKPLADTLTRTVVPALGDTRKSAGQDTPDAIRALTSATTASTAAMGRDWTGLGRTLADNTSSMARAMDDFQGRHNAAWANIRARAGAEISTITGPQFGGLHAGMDAVGAHAANMAGGWGAQFGRLIPLTGDPIRWSLTFPINRGLVGAWNAINAFFALNRPMGPVPVGFARGTEDHRAQIAEPGQIRVWNEPETQGEAYIPLAPAKRRESMRILDEVAKRFDRRLTPHFADGGIVEPYFADATRMIGDITRFFGPAFIPSGLAGEDSQAVRAAQDAAGRLIAAAMPTGGSGVERWRPVGLRALAVAGQPATEWPRMAMQMTTESGGNPYAVNNWDINAQRGTPSVGLMQVIGPTYRTYHHPQFNAPPFAYGVSEDGMSNILASTRYSLAAYGSLANAWHGHGYDLGGILQSGRFAVNASGHPERVLDPRTTQAFERLVSVLSTVRGSMPLVLSAPQQAQVQGAIQMAAPELAALGRVISQELQRAMPSLDGLKLQIIDDGRNGVARIVQRQVRDLVRSGWGG